MPSTSPWMAAVAQSECLLLLSRALHGLLREHCQEDSSEHCGRRQCRLWHLPAQQLLVVYWVPQPFRQLLQDGLQGYHSPAPPELAPAAEAATRALPLCLTSPPGCGEACRVQPGQLSVCAHKKVGVMDGGDGSTSSFSLCRVWVAPLTPEAGE